jgi:hypothetical protein
MAVNDAFVSDVHTLVDTRGAMGAMHPLETCTCPLGIRIISKTPCHIGVLRLMIRRGWKQTFSKMYECAKCFVQCYGARYVIEVFV